MGAVQNRSIVAEGFQVNQNAIAPIWLQLRNRIIHLISSGKLAPGDQLPSTRLLAVELEVNMNTISKVYHDLQKDGFIESRRGKGLYVTDLKDVNAGEIQNAGAALAEEFLGQCYASGMTPEEILDLVRRTMDEMDRKT